MTEESLLADVEAYIRDHGHGNFLIRAVSRREDGSPLIVTDTRLAKKNSVRTYLKIVPYENGSMLEGIDSEDLYEAENNERRIINLFARKKIKEGNALRIMEKYFKEKVGDVFTLDPRQRAQLYLQIMTKRELLIKESRGKQTFYSAKPRE